MPDLIIRYLQDLKQLTSSVPGKWTVAISVPHVFVENQADASLQIVLTADGFVVLGGGRDPQGLIVEKGTIRPLAGPDASFLHPPHPSSCRSMI